MSYGNVTLGHKIEHCHCLVIILNFLHQPHACQQKQMTCVQQLAAKNESKNCWKDWGRKWME